MKISVLIPSYNGRSKIPVLLDALNQQSFKDFETIISLDTSMDGSYEYLILNPFQLANYSVVCSKVQKGRAGNRNAAAKIATGEILLFLDDDMLPTNTLVDQHTEHHEKYIGSLLTGPVPEDISLSNEDLHKYKAHLSDKWVKDLRKETPFLFQKNNLFLTAANFSIPKKIFVELDGFKESLQDAEDFDLAVRAFIAGYSVYFDARVIAYHREVINISSYIRRLRQYRTANLMLVANANSECKTFLKQEAKPKFYHFKKIIYCLFVQRFWFRFIHSTLFLKLPIVIRFKIYDLIFAGWSVYFTRKKV